MIQSSWAVSLGYGTIPLGDGCCSCVLGLKDMHGPHYVLPADGAFVHPFAALCTSDHVAAFQENAVDRGIHADPAEIVVANRERTDFPVCKTGSKKTAEVRRLLKNLIWDMANIYIYIYIIHRLQNLMQCMMSCPPSLSKSQCIWTFPWQHQS